MMLRPHLQRRATFKRLVDVAGLFFVEKSFSVPILMVLLPTGLTSVLKLLA